MAKVFTYLIVVTGLMMLFNLAGLNTTTGYVLTKLNILNPENIPLSGFYVAIAAIFLSAAVGGIVIGFFTKSSPESFLISGYASILLLFVSDMVFIIVYLTSNYGGWISAIAGLLVVPLIIGYLHAVVSWWGSKE